MIDGEMKKCDCSIREMVPASSKDLAKDMVVILMPLHFEESVVGYLGMWQSGLKEINRISMFQFLRALDTSFAYKLSY